MIYINGRFLDKKITGVPLFGLEILKQVDIKDSINKYALLIPHIKKLNYYPKNIKTIKIGIFKSNLWEQISLYRFMRKHKKDYLLNLCNTAPILLKSYITIHDIGLIKHKYKSKTFTLWYKFMYSKIVKKAYRIFTDSQFSKTEITDYYKTSINKTLPVYIGSEHILNVKYDDSLITKYKLKPNNYYLFVGSNLIHKNLNTLFKYFSKRSNLTLVLASSSKFNNLPKNVIHIKDFNFSQLKSLYKNAYCYIMPSLYEGFGIPPLEAMASGCKHILLSDIPVFKEIYGNGVNYIKDINNFDMPADMKEVDKSYLDNLLTKYSWKRSADIIIKIIENDIKENNK